MVAVVISVFIITLSCRNCYQSPVLRLRLSIASGAGGL